MFCLEQGMAGEMSGPTLPDLKNRIGVDYEEISRALVGKSAGERTQLVDKKLRQHCDTIACCDVIIRINTILIFIHVASQANTCV